jgi:microcystin-dependent protein
MSEAYLGEIRLFAGSYAPTDFMLCDGKEISLFDYNALYQLIGTLYGGDGEMTFGLPDMRGRVTVHQGPGVGLHDYPLAQAGGVETVTLTSTMMPVHSHVVSASPHPGTESDPTPGASVISALGPGTTPEVFVWQPAGSAPQLTLSPRSTSLSGGSQAHDNVQPSVAVSYIICVRGLVPQRP